MEAQSPPVSADPRTAHYLTVSRGPRSNPRGRPLHVAGWAASRGGSADTLPAVVARILHALWPDGESWWSPHSWQGGRRSGQGWIAASALVLDLDHHDESGAHAEPTLEMAMRARDLAESGAIPGHLFHATPRGARVVAVLPQPISVETEYRAAIAAYAEAVRAALAPVAAGPSRAGYTVDERATDLARFLYAPRARVDGVQRDAQTIVMRTGVYTGAPEPPPLAVPGSSSSGPSISDARRAWLADHPREWPRSGTGQCPICGHQRCFGAIPDAPGKWHCFSANHGETGLATSGGRMGDALDIEAHARGLSATEVLRADGYLGNIAPPPRSRSRATRPTILVRQELAEVCDEAMAAIQADPLCGVYQRGGMLCRVSGRTIQPLTPEALRELLDRSADWVRFDGKSKREVPTLPPDWVAKTILSRPSWTAPPLDAVIESPALRHDGSVILADGYDLGSGLLLSRLGPFPEIPAAPGYADAVAACARLLEPFSDFPFVAPHDRSAALAATLSLAGRTAISGCVPLFAVRATTPGSGKGLLADVISLIGTGRIAAKTTLVRDEQEFRKIVLGVAIDGAPVVLLDNVTGAIGNPTLAAVLTASEWEDRQLGGNRRIRTPLRAVWIATGNSLTFKGDLARRVIAIDLDPQREDPENRSGFTHPELLSWVGLNRGRLLVDCLTVLRAHALAGRPGHGGPRRGSFESWDEVVRSALVWANAGDPCAGVERLAREDDSDRLALAAVLECWHEAFGEEPRTAAEACSAATSAPGGDTAFRDALLEISKTDRLDANRVGYALRTVRGRIISGMSIRQDGVSRGRTKWKILTHK